MQVNLDQIYNAVKHFEGDGRFAEAESLLTNAMQLFDHPQLYMECAAIQIKERRIEAAATSLRKLLEKFPELDYGKKFLDVINYIAAGKNTAILKDGDVTFELAITGENWEIEYEWINGRFYEPQELTYLAENVQSGSILLDIGANSGNHALFVAMKRPDITVMVFEPEPRAVAIIKKNIELNRVTNIDTSKLGMAVSSSNDPIHMLFQDSLTSTERGVPGLGIEVPCITLTEVLSPQTRFIKLDIESMEMEVLAPAIERIREFGVSVMIEMLDKNREEMEKFLHENNLKIIHRIPMHAGENIIISPN